MTAESWDTIADWYANRIREGSPMHDFARDILLGEMPSDLTGLRVLDVGCGEGIVTRAVAARGASALGIDLSVRMIALARSAVQARGPVQARPAGVRPVDADPPVAPCYTVDDAQSLRTVGDSSIDWVTAGLALNNVPDLGATVASVRRVLAVDGRLVFTIPHPCFEAPYASWTADGGGRIVGDYLIEGFWRSDDPEAVRRAGNYHRTLSTYVAVLTTGGFAIERVSEPAPDIRVTTEQPRRAALPPFLLVVARRT